MTLNPAQSAPQSVNPNFTPASLYVGDLKPDVSEALLFDVFNTVGPVASIRVCRDVVSRRSLGYAYVNFHSVSDAERALDTMNFSSIRGRSCRIMWSQRDPSLRKSGVGNIFVKNLDKSIDHKTLYDTFSMFGNILSCKVATNERGESLGYGFVHYETQDSAQKAIEKVDGMVIASREVHVAPFMPKSQRDGPDSAAFTNVYVKGLPAGITKEKLVEIFSQFGGKITSASVPTDAEGKARGFGFVNFDNAEEAAVAVNQLNERDGMYVGRAQKKDEREKELRDKFEQLRIQQAEKYAGVNLYIKNLDDSVGDDQLRDEFKQFGEITSAKVMRDANGRSKGFGFVCFTKREEAAKAVTDMNTKLIGNKPLYVALAQRRELRRQQLEAQAQVNRNKMATGLPPPQMYAGAPMFYQQPAGPQMPRGTPGFMYPTQQMMGQQRWNPRQAQSPQLIAMPPRPGVGVQPQMPNMYLMQQLQQQGRGMGGMPGGQRGGRGRGNVGKPAGGVPRQQMPPQAQQNRIKFSDNVRNPQVPATAPAAANGINNVTPAGPNAIPQNAGPVPLTSQALARAPAQQQKQMIGERIFPLIQEREAKLAGKITGMLLEMDNTELLHLLESSDALEAKISEALAVLQQHGNTGAAPEAPAAE
uniref:Polyadenylate-binding protein n=1 Tax=Hirondellea gigas TaxID=1518452 RepID=A0A6A7FVD6_9CRUS